MKIVFESNLEREAWELFLEAHRKWYKNHGDELVEMVMFTGEIYKYDEAVVETACNMVTYPEKIKTEDSPSCEELFTREEAEALIGKKLKDVDTSETLKVVGYTGDGYLEVEYDDGSLDEFNKSDYRELLVEV
ncbi:hypothetical protein GFC01_17595 [Desulfofundulus thermobenzoicus]|uniref:Uncharacterized protein n=1 Tax=Desulfofundulus thermobenzoicus TaxID=29376 RepID=A0A6N7IWN7_9FIRM|nr:hypothetical protein [Desulfofundulus thermobenzoicus]MQL54033.1 hypothetical protein [Desulfofundulus thermobenzoicus]